MILTYGGETLIFLKVPAAGSQYIDDAQSEHERELLAADCRDGAIGGRNGEQRLVRLRSCDREP
jgi:hypothetical protein